MRKFLSLCLVLMNVFSFAQDTIVRLDSAKIVAKVLTVDQKIITYQRYGAPDGPTYTISRNDVARVAYADGFSEKFGKRSAIDPVRMKKNSASITITDAVSGMLTVNYERVFWNDLGVRLQASHGMLSGKVPSDGSYFYQVNNYYSRFKPISLTLDVHYYAHHSSTISYYVGAAMEYGQRKECTYWGGCFPPYTPTGVRIVEYYMAGLTNGVALRPNGPISLDIYTTLGFSRDYRWDELTAAARFGFNVGYRF